MPRRHRKNGQPQHGKERKRRKSWHRSHTSANVRRAAKWLNGDAS